MATVEQLTRRLAERPPVPEIPGVRVRTYAGPEDIGPWLELRQAAFARQKLGVRRWDAADFAAEFLEKPWWDPQGLWFAEAPPCGQGGRDLLHQLLPIGTISLAWRGTPPDAKPAIHWLAVLPSQRRRGIARLLVSTLEAACWDLGHRQIWLETHTSWSEAAKFYQALGYRPATEP